MKRHGIARAAISLVAVVCVYSRAGGQSPREFAPVDLTGQWVSVVTEDWAWRMRTPPRGDYASLPLTEAGARAADRWTNDQDGSCLAFGAAALLRMPTRLRISWDDDNTLIIESDNGMQTRVIHFDENSRNPARSSLQGYSTGQWQTANLVTGSGATGGILTTSLQRSAWASLKVETTHMSSAWLRPNGVPYSDEASMTEFFDRFSEGSDEWFTVTSIVVDPIYLSEPLVISSNFLKEADNSKWNPKPCKN